MSNQEILSISNNYVDEDETIEIMLVDEGSNEEVKTYEEMLEERDIHENNSFLEEQTETRQYVLNILKYFDKSDLLQYYEKMFEENKLFEHSTNKYYTSIFESKPLFQKIGKNVEKRRKNMDDDIRKKIKTDFYKEIQKSLNEKLKYLNIKDSFAFTKSMKEDVSLDKCHKNLRMSLKEMLVSPPKQKPNDLQILENNSKILKQKEINKLDKILNKKIEELYNDYLESQNFQKSIKKLKEKKDGNYEYINKYIEVAKKVIKYYNSYDETTAKKSAKPKKHKMIAPNDLDQEIHK